MEKLRYIRTKKGLTQKSLALLTGLSQPYINELEKGRKLNPSYEVLVKLARALDVSINDLVGEREVTA